MYSGHYTASINCCKRTFYCNDSKITEFEMIDSNNSSTAYVVVYKLITWWFSDYSRRMGVLITPMTLAHPLHPIESGSRNKRLTLWFGWCVSSWRPCFWPVHSIYYIHTTHCSRTLTYGNKLFLRDIHTNSWYDHAGVLDDLILSGFRRAFSCVVQYSLCHGMDIGTCDIVHWSATPYHRKAYRTVFGVCVVLVLNVIRCSCH